MLTTAIICSPAGKFRSDWELGRRDERELKDSIHFRQELPLQFATDNF